MESKAKKPHPTAALSMNLWKRLYDAALRVRQMEPWNWMEETELFGFQPAGAKEPAFVSVMGALGEHFAIGVYPSVAAMNRFWDMQRASQDYPRPEMLLEIPQIQVSFGPASELEPAEKRIAKTLGHKPRGAAAWPCFRSFRPGHAPWHIDPAEGALMLVAMEQVLERAPRLLEDCSDIPFEIGPDQPIPFRIQKDDVWEEVRRAFPYECFSLNVGVPANLMDAVNALPQKMMCLEVDLPILPTNLGKPGERPKLPYLLMVADAASEFILGSEMLTVESTMADFWGGIPQRILALLAKHQIRPATLAVKNHWMRQLLEPLGNSLGITIRMEQELPALAKILAFMTRRFC